MTTTTRRFFYAVSYLSGRQTTTTTRRRVRPMSLETREVVVPAVNVFRFESLAAARAWVAESPWSKGREGGRELVSDAPAHVQRHVAGELRRARAAGDHGPYWLESSAVSRSSRIGGEVLA